MQTMKNLFFEMILESIVIKYKADGDVFFGECHTDNFALIEGSLGSILVLMSYVENKRFIGDLVFNL